MKVIYFLHSFVSIICLYIYIYYIYVLFIYIHDLIGCILFVTVCVLVLLFYWYAVVCS